MLDKITGKQLFPKAASTIIGEGSVFEEAVLKGGGVVRIDGNFSGTIDIQGHVILGETGVFNGEIHTDSALIAGKFNGKLYIKDVLHAKPTAFLTGVARTGSLIVDQGAVFNVSCRVLRAGTNPDMDDEDEDDDEDADGDGE